MIECVLWQDEGVWCCDVRVPSHLGQRDPVVRVLVRRMMRVVQDVSHGREVASEWHAPRPAILECMIRCRPSDGV